MSEYVDSLAVLQPLDAKSLPFFPFVLCPAGPVAVNVTPPHLQTLVIEGSLAS